jgi:copper oxidase (laccase) domain-containing protein
VVHAGWKGTVAHVARKAVETMARDFDSDPVRFVAAIGPSIGPDSYDVGPEVAEQARAAFPDADVIDDADSAKPRFDLWAANTADLVAAGLRRENVEVAGIDTFTDERFFSHRRQAPTGRFMAYAALGTDVYE